MTTNKPEVVAWSWDYRGRHMATTDYSRALELAEPPYPTEVEPLIRLADYQRLQADHERLQAAHEEELFGVRQDRDTHFGELMRAIERVDVLQAECEKLRKAIRRLCNIYVVDDYYSGDLREEMLDRAVERSIVRAAMKGDKP